MNLNALSTREMISVTNLWTGPQRELFLSIPKIAPFFEDVAQAHAQLVNLSQALTGDEGIARLTRALAATDRRHDEAIRCVHETLSGAIHYLRMQDPPRTSEADRLEALLDRLLPDGVSLVQRSYREEAGYAESLIAGLETPTQQELQAIPVLGGNLLEVVLLWVDLGQKLAQLESQRSFLVASVPAVTSEKERRSGWLQAVKQVMSSLELVKGRDEAVTAIRQPLIDAEAAAVARSERQEAIETPRTVVPSNAPARS